MCWVVRVARGGWVAEVGCGGWIRGGGGPFGGGRGHVRDRRVQRCGSGSMSRWCRRGSGRRERVDGVEGRLQRVGVAVAGGEPEDRASGAADDPGGDVEQDPAQRVGVAAQRRVLGRGAGRAGGRGEVADPGGDVEGEQRGGHPDAVGVDVAGREVAQRLAGLAVLEAFFDLGAVAVVVLDPRGVLVGVVGEDEAVAVDGVDLAV